MNEQEKLLNKKKFDIEFDVINSYINELVNEKDFKMETEQYTDSRCYMIYKFNAQHSIVFDYEVHIIANENNEYYFVWKSFIGGILKHKIDTYNSKILIDIFDSHVKENFK